MVHVLKMGQFVDHGVDKGGIPQWFSRADVDEAHADPAISVAQTIPFTCIGTIRIKLERRQLELLRHTDSIALDLRDQIAVSVDFKSALLPLGAGKCKGDLRIASHKDDL